MLVSFIWDEDPSDDEEEHGMIDETIPADSKKQEHDAIIKDVLI